MKHAKVLDCTLRDGAYLIDKKFGVPVIKGITKGLVESQIDFIEIGFLQDEGFGEGKVIYKNAKEAEEYIPKNKKGCQFTVLADFSRYSIENLEKNNGESFDAVRECFFKSEWKEAIEVCKKIKEKGYKVFVQPVDILGYDDIELLQLVNEINIIEPYCVSIVDTFGSMYIEDLRRVFSILDHNLNPVCKVGFHSHNNMQMSNALSQEFLSISLGKRDVVVDGTLCGMGRGAGNTPTELIVQYMIDNLGYTYNLDAILDTIDDYMNNIRTKCNWGYTIPYFIAGAYSAHVNNISYLLNKNSIRFKDIRYILNREGIIERKRYDYNLLEKMYYERMNCNIDDKESLEYLRQKLQGRKILLLAPGKKAKEQKEKIVSYIEKETPVVITLNYIHEDIKSDFMFISNIKRYDYWANTEGFFQVPKIITSNILNNEIENSIIVSFGKLIKCGWDHMDNAIILLLRLLDIISVEKIFIAGLDGYCFENKVTGDFVNQDLESISASENPMKLNNEIESMLRDYIGTRVHNVPLEFVTSSRFEVCIK